MTIYHSEKVQTNLDFMTRVPKNLLINGNFNVWQRGTVFNPINPNLMYTADRWYIGVGSALTNRRVVRPSAGGIPLNEIYIQRLSGDTSTQAFTLCYRFEAAETLGLRGETLTLSFNALAGADYSAVDNILDVRIFTHTDNDEGFTLTSSGLFPTTGRTQVERILPELTTSRTKYTMTLTVPTDANQMQIWFYYNPTGTAGAADLFRISEVQLEVGGHFTSFEHRPLAEEVIMCQRYYEQSSPGVMSDGMARHNQPIITSYSTGAARTMISWKVLKRVTPTITIFRTTDGGTNGMPAYFNGSAWVNATSIAFNTNNARESTLEMVGTYVALNSYISSFGWVADAEL